MLSFMPISHPMLDATLFDALTCDALLAPAGRSRLARADPVVSARGDKYTISISAPGVAAADLEIDAVDGRLAVRGETVTASHTHFVNSSVALPPDADVEKASAESEDGVVTVSVPKKAKAPPARIAIRTDAAEQEPAAEDGAAPPYTLTVVAAGIAAADLELSVDADAGVLVVKGATERTGAAIDRRFRLPRDADAEVATATHRDGLLTVSVPRKAASAARQIKVAAPSTAAADTETMEEEEGVMI